MHKGLKSIAKTAYLSYEALTNRRFYDLRVQTNGMLLPIVYKTIYELCAQLPDLDIIEVGGATGAGSIAIAWAMNDAKKNSQLIVVEKCEGGTRTDVGGYDDNLKLIQEHFENFGARDRINLFPHEVTFENGQAVLDRVKTAEIAAFMHDADGRLDRDFYLFWNRLQPGGLIIVDDYANEAKYKPISDRHPQGGSKSVITYRLLNQIIQWGLFEPTHKIGKTIFGIKPLNADFNRFNLDVCERIIASVQRERETFLKQQEKPLVMR
jgi:predicted O-methyltransferase YrrM